MNYDKIIIEMLDRIKTLEDKVTTLEENRKETQGNKGGTLTQGVRDYIMQRKMQAKAQGLTEIVLLCNGLQKEFGVTNRAPAVCAAMYDCMEEGDEVLFAPPSGKSTTVKIKYLIK